jgi:o-succinylbenzoate synthase
MNVERFALELTEPLATARGTIDRREGFLVTVAVDGTRGVGEATPLPGWTESLADCRDAIDRAPDDVRAALDEVDPATTPAARHGLESALLDATGRERDVPAYRLLAAGGSGAVVGRGGVDQPDRVDRVPVNATLGDADVEPLVDAATQAVDAGFSCLKCKVGAGSLERDVERLQAVRDAVGEAVALRADANASWDLATAERAVDAFAGIGCSLLEQPLAVDELDAHATLRGRGVRIALDEGALHYSPAAIAAADAADGIVCKPMALGGPMRASEVAGRARERGLTPIVSTTIDAAVGRAAAVHVAAAVPDVEHCGLSTADRLQSDVAPDPAPIEDGAARVPQEPGLGVTLREGRHV